jgi:hypothetical protein
LGAIGIQKPRAFQSGSSKVLPGRVSATIHTQSKTSNSKKRGGSKQTEERHAPIRKASTAEQSLNGRNQNFLPRTLLLAANWK